MQILGKDGNVVGSVPPVQVAGGEVNHAEVERLEKEREILRNAGYEQSGEFFAVGTVMTSGQEVKRKEREAIQKLPPAYEVAEAFAERIRSEKRANVVGLDLAYLRVSPEGDRIGWKMPNGFLQGRPTETAWAHLGGMLVSPGLAAYLPHANAELRKSVIASHIASRVKQKHDQRLLAEQNAREEGRTLRGPRFDGDLPVSVGLRRAINGRELDLPQIYRIAGPAYLPLEGDTIGSMLADSLPAEYRGRVDYNGESWTFEALAVDPSDAPGMVGETFSVGLVFRGDDVKRGTLEAYGYANRWRCLNGTILNSKKNLINRKHIGKIGFSELVGLVRNALKQADKDFGYFLDKWSSANNEIIEINPKYGEAKWPTMVFGGLVDSGLIALPGGFDETVSRLEVSWEKEPAFTRAGIVNAVTRAAHTTPWWHDLDAAHAAESQASNILHLKTLPEIINAAISKREELDA